MSAPSNNSFPFRLEFPPGLPISARAEEITTALAEHQVVILAGETGSGKTTQIPKMCLAAGRGMKGKIACTQPRRVAALSISRRVAEEMGVDWGREVGCKIRFNDQTTRETVVKFLTDGMLLAEAQGDPLLRDYDTIIIDEAHERSLNIDFLLGHLRGLRFRRPDLKIVITSATIDTETFSAAFDGAPVIKVEGRTFPVEVVYAPLDSFGSDYTENDENEEKDDLAAVASAKAEALHYVDGAVAAVERIVGDGGPGDVLVFLPSERDIREVSDVLEGRRLRDCEIVPLFGRLSNAEQQRVFAPTQRRKIVLATNIAETSLTIPGIRFVVDTGLARLSRYAPQARTRRLPIEEVSQSSADQRKGRCGRVADGVCIRLYSEKDFLERPRFTQPEIQRANLADVILRLKASGFGEVERFPFINPPATKAIRAGYGLLEELGAIAAGTPRSGDGSWVIGQGKDKEHGANNPSTHDPSPLTHELTLIGRELARLPVDPTVGRMILQARAEKALREVIVIAAGLSIQDPRERPLEKQQQADAAHRRFAHPDSDFLTLLNIWDAWRGEFESMNQGKFRRFCRDHFLSYTRMREWRDIHSQLVDTLREREEFRMTSVFDGVPPEKMKLDWGTPAYRAIHRSVLAGLLGNIACYDEDARIYKATHDRKVVLFPGSVLFKRDDPKKRPTEPAKSDTPKKTSKVPLWIMTAEIMETTRIYARTCARLDPLWALELGAHLVRVSHSEPFWNADNGRVLVKQRTRLYGLELEPRAVSYGKINPREATEIFIREGLVNDTIVFPLDCLTHNRALREKIESQLTRTRDAGYLNLDEAAYRFYAARLLPEKEQVGGVREDESRGVSAVGVSSVGELVDLVRERRMTEPEFLKMAADNLRDPATLAHDAEAFPEALPIDNRALPLNYTYKPGQSDDGVTLDVNIREAEALTPAALDWAVPGHLEAKVEHYLRSLPKDLRRGFVPLGESVKRFTDWLAQRDRLTGRRDTLPEALAAEMRERFKLSVDVALFAEKPPPEHLRVRVRVVDDAGRELCASRELDEIRAALTARARGASASVAREEPAAWRAARVKWETAEKNAWAFGDVPGRVLVAEQAGVPVFAFPGLIAGAGGAALRLFKTPEEAAVATAGGLEKLLELQLSRELVWLERDLRALREVGPLAATLVPLAELQAQALEGIRAWVCDAGRMKVGSHLRGDLVGTAADEGGSESRPHLVAAAFAAALEKSQTDLRGLVPRLVDLLKEILSLRLELQVHAQPYAGLEKEIAALLPTDFVRATPFGRLAQLPRYLKAMKLRADRWRQNPLKDAERVKQFAPYEKALATLRGRRDAASVQVRWLVEEFRVSVFAQELGTAEPVSAVKLERALEGLRAGGVARVTEVSAVVTRPIVSAPVAQKKSTPLKSLGALDKIFPR